MRRLLLTGLVSVLFGILSAQSVTPPGANPTTPVTTPAVVPKEYAADEFPTWLLALRRAEILAIGALPVTTLFAGLGFDYVYYAAKGAPAANVPWPLGPGTSGWTESTNSSDLASKNLTIVATSVGLALAIAAADWLIGALSAAPTP